MVTGLYGFCCRGLDGFVWFSGGTHDLVAKDLKQLGWGSLQDFEQFMVVSLLAEKRVWVSIA